MAGREGARHGNNRGSSTGFCSAVCGLGGIEDDEDAGPAPADSAVSSALVGKRPSFDATRPARASGSADPSSEGHASNDLTAKRDSSNGSSAKEGKAGPVGRGCTIDRSLQQAAHRVAAQARRQVFEPRFLCRRRSACEGRSIGRCPEVVGAISLGSTASSVRQRAFTGMHSSTPAASTEGISSVASGFRRQRPTAPHCKFADSGPSR
jgi:hypothetical protein